MKNDIRKILKESELDWIGNTGEPFSEVIEITKKSTGLENVVRMTCEVMHGDGDSYDTTTVWFKSGDITPQSRWSPYEYVDGKNFFSRSDLMVAKNYLDALDNNNNGWCEDCCEELGLTEEICRKVSAMGLISSEEHSGINGYLEGVELVYYDGSGNQHDAKFK